MNKYEAANFVTYILEMEQTIICSNLQVNMM